MRLYAGISPSGLWSEPCEVTCACGYRQQCPDLFAAQTVAWQHDRQHEAGTIETAEQLELSL